MGDRLPAAELKEEGITCIQKRRLYIRTRPGSGGLSPIAVLPDAF
nr:hypothetical protein [uncultured Oscillibacter sp.]